LFSGLDDLRETVERLKNQVAESARQESMLVMRLADKEQEVQDLLVSYICFYDVHFCNDKKPCQSNHDLTTLGPRQKISRWFLHWLQAAKQIQFKLTT